MIYLENRDWEIICQNCRKILGNLEKGVLDFDKDEIESISDNIGKDNKQVSLTCPKCFCVTEIIV